MQRRRLFLETRYAIWLHIITQSSRSFIYYIYTQTLLEQLRRDDRKWRAAEEKEDDETSAGGISDGAGGIYGAVPERTTTFRSCSNRHHHHRCSITTNAEGPPFAADGLGITGGEGAPVQEFLL